MGWIDLRRFERSIRGWSIGVNFTGMVVRVLIVVGVQRDHGIAMILIMRASALCCQCYDGCIGSVSSRHVDASMRFRPAVQLS